MHIHVLMLFELIAINYYLVGGREKIDFVKMVIKAIVMQHYKMRTVK